MKKELEELEYQLKKVFLEVAPNTLITEYIYYRPDLMDYTAEEIEQALENLSSSGFLVKKAYAKNRAEFERFGYHIKDLGSYPIEPTITVGGLKIPRLIDGDTPRSEDINQSIISVARLAEAMEEKLDKGFQKHLRQYWVNLITVFGIFLALFSVITIASTKTPLDSSIQGWDRFCSNLADITPLALILVGFIITLKWLLSK